MTIRNICFLLSWFFSLTLFSQNDSQQTQAYTPCEYSTETAVVNAENGIFVSVKYGNTYFSDWNFQQLYESYLQENQLFDKLGFIVYYWG